MSHLFHTDLIIYQLNIQADLLLFRRLCVTHASQVEQSIFLVFSIGCRVKSPVRQIFAEAG